MSENKNNFLVPGCISIILIWILLCMALIKLDQVDKRVKTLEMQKQNHKD